MTETASALFRAATKPIVTLPPAIALLSDRVLPDLPAHKYNLTVHNGWGRVDNGKVKALIEASFGKKLVADYFEGKEPIAVIIEENYRGVAIVKEVDGMPYLDKLATTPELKKNGLGGEMMARLKEMFPSLIWRARTENGFNGRYFQCSDGHFKSGQWTVFWYGLGLEEAQPLVTKALSIPETLISEPKAG